ncbi:hypothetical protein RUND412_010311 [Rhizina undulata]
MLSSYTSAHALPPGNKQRSSRRLAVPQNIFDTVKFALSKMANIREILITLEPTRLDYDYEWPENSILKDVRNFFIMRSNSNEQPLQMKAFHELLAGASQAQTRLDKLTIHSIWRGILRDHVDAIPEYAPGFQNLTSLTLFFCTDGHGYDFKRMLEDAFKGRIFKFLSMAPMLKKL